MRISTSTIYESQTASIDNLVAQQQAYGATLSSGKQLNAPSDDTAEIAQDLSIRTTLAQQNQTSANLRDINAELTTVDGSLSTLTDVMQKARAIAVAGASDAINPSQTATMADQVDGLLQEAIGIANTQYAGKYVFGGTAVPSGPVVIANGQPVSAVSFNGNLSAQVQQFANGQSATTSITVQQAFNVNASDGSPDVFQTLINLRDTLRQQSVVDQSSAAVNKAGTAIAAASALNSASFKTAIVPDSSGNVSINIATSTNVNGVTLTFPPATSIGAVITAINGAGLGVTASFNAKTQQLSIASATNQPFQIKDIASPGATNTSNFVAAFNLQPQADFVNTVSRQIGDFDHALQVTTNTRSSLGSTIQTLNNLSSSTDSQVVNNQKVQSGIEDADIAKVIAQFSQTQTALQAAYGTTTRLEGKTLFDYLQ